MYGALAAAFGWTEEQSGKITLLRWYEYVTYWKKHPPLYILAAAYMGYKPPMDITSIKPPDHVDPLTAPKPVQGSSEAMNPAEFAAYVKMTGGKIPGFDKTAP